MMYVTRCYGCIPPSHQQRGGAIGGGMKGEIGSRSMRGPMCPEEEGLADTTRYARRRFSDPPSVCSCWRRRGRKAKEERMGTHASLLSSSCAVAVAKLSSFDARAERHGAEAAVLFLVAGENRYSLGKTQSPARPVESKHGAIKPL